MRFPRGHIVATNKLIFKREGLGTSQYIHEIPSLVLIRVVLTEIQGFNREMYGMPPMRGDYRQN